MPIHDVLLNDIRQRIDYAALFAEFLPNMRGSGAERRAFCIFHQNTQTPALSVNVEEGLYRCHNPECGASGDFIDFYMRMRSVTFVEALNELARRVGIDPTQYTRHATATTPPTEVDEAALIASYHAPAPREDRRPDAEPRFIDEAIVTSAHERLMSIPSLVEWLRDRRGLTQDTLREYQIGHDGQRYYIPVRDSEARIVNIRRYKPGAAAVDKMISWRPGFGAARLYPEYESEQDNNLPVYILEGEMDTLLARQMGLNAITTTGGAGTWREEWNERFRDLAVVVCYDHDEAGRIGALNVARNLHNIARSIRIVTIPLAEPPGADFTDYIVGHGHTGADFALLVERAPEFAADEARNVPAPVEPPLDVHLADAAHAEHLNHTIRFEAMVSGKTTAPYFAPRRTIVYCGDEHRGRYRMCERCPVAAAGPVTVEVSHTTNEPLNYIGVADAVIERQLKAKANVPAKCPYAKPTTVESINIEDVQIIPAISRSTRAHPYVTRQVFFIPPDRQFLEANRTYIMTGVTVPEPKRQLVTHLITSAVPSQSNIAMWRMTPELNERLRQFQSVAGDGVDGLWRKADEMYDDLERVTRIYQRRDLMLTVDLVFHSVLSFPFQGERLQRGWCEALVIGDSRTGKTSVVQRMVEHYGAGELSSGENTTLAGLVGGLHQIGTSWALQWGRIPLNDRRLLVIDEASNLPLEHIARLSSMRSSGIAEIVKVHTERTNARTRQIWLSNPRSPRPLSTFSQGVLAVKELVGAPEDIARFDLVATAASSDVALSTINADRGPEEPETYTADLCHQRVMWAWSREPHQIEWTAEAIPLVLRYATMQGEEFRHATEIPIVEPNEQRVKLARVAVAVAAMFYSASPSGEAIVVHRSHVEFAYQFLEQLYAKQSLAFTEYARMMTRRNEIDDRDGRVAVVIRHSPGAARTLMEQEQLTQRDLAEILGYDERDQLREAVALLRDRGFLRRQGSSYYLKTTGAIAWLRRELSLEPGGLGARPRLAAVAGGAPDDPEW